ncbi:MurT ligase domain-containing protein [Actinomycetospora chlora]|uniref:Lipid II isoglutaminyl synthase (glutamine-hydrolyzing) subunit MurT n=2 Tax=Actinomycetospora chlora TaxID=663608 RepID=A0ABP9B4S5_9PSEU
MLRGRRSDATAAPGTRAARPSWGARVAARAGRGAARVSRGLGVGGAAVLPGRVASALWPGALRELAAGRHVTLVAGTNGKTTTTHMLAAATATAGPVAHNRTGANMADGALAALIDAPTAPRAVLEVDELHLPAVAAATDPAVIVLLNLTRDQLDRVSEVGRTAAAIRAALAARPGTAVVANADDPLIAWAAGGSAHTTWVGAGARWRGDSHVCPRCATLLVDDGGCWACPGCGLRRPEVTWWAEEVGGDALVVHGPGPAEGLALRPGLPGAANRANALMALAASAATGTPVAPAAAAIAVGDEVVGRYARRRVGPWTLRLLLVKNPAGWQQTQEILDPAAAVLMVVNARQADGADVSWLWDLDLTSLAGRQLAVAGERGADLGVRLSYAGVAHHHAPDPLAALRALPAGPVDVVANYSAFLALHGRLAREREQ